MAVAAGIPPEIGNEFVAKFIKTSRIMSWLPLDRSKCYTDSYSEMLYEQLAEKLKKHEQPNRHPLLSDVNLVLLYLHKDDGSESMLYERFGVELLVVPLKRPEIAGMPLATGNQRRRAVNALVREGSRAIRHAQALLAVIAEEVTNRDNKTCLLLPHKNFGRGVNDVFDSVRDAVLAGEGRNEFKKRLRRVSRSLDTVREARREYFVGQGGLVFKSPGKAGARHGLAPTWEDAGHDSSCVIRGRMRLGTSYDPKFHYDCAIPGNRSRNFPSCHGVKDVPRNRGHVNIAPNDNVR